MNINDYSGVFVFAQQVDGKLTSVGLELCGKGKQLAGDLGVKLTAVLLGSGVAGLTGDLLAHGADRVIFVDDEKLGVYMTEPYVYALSKVIENYKPEILLVGATAIGRDMTPRVSARVRTGLTADCTALDIDPETRNLLMTRPRLWRQHHGHHPLPQPPASDGDGSPRRHAKAAGERGCG